MCSLPCKIGVETTYLLHPLRGRLIGTMSRICDRRSLDQPYALFHLYVHLDKAWESRIAIQISSIGQLIMVFQPIGPIP